MTTKLPIGLIQNGTPNTILGTDSLKNVIEYNEILFTDSAAKLTYKTNTSIDISNGLVVGSNDSVSIPNLTKNITALWSQGNNVGGLDVGVRGAYKVYNVFAIKNINTAAGDVIFSEAQTPALPTNWKNIKRIGSIHTNASSNIMQFEQSGKRFMFTHDQIHEGTSIGGAPGFGGDFTINAMHVPKNVPVTMIIYIWISGQWTWGQINSIRIPGQPAPATPMLGVMTQCRALGAGYAGATSNTGTATFDIYNPNSNNFICNVSSGGPVAELPSIYFSFFTLGYIDHSI